MLSIAMEHFPADARQPAEVIRERLIEADAVLLLLGTRMGSRVPGGKKYYIQLEYEKNFQGKAIVLHDKMLKDIPPNKAGLNNIDYYQHLAGVSPITEIAIDLERLSSLLPD